MLGNTRHLISATAFVCLSWQTALATSTLPSEVYELSGIGENLPNDDLLPLLSLTSRADVIGLGDIVHTSEGSYRAKFRMITFLVEQGGIRAITFENNWGDSRALNEFVQTCKGSAQQVIREKMYGIW